MTLERYDVIVLGLGAMGSATAFELARRGRCVLGVEQFPLVHDLGSSHGHTRVIRKAYYEHPAYVPLAQRAYERWYELEQRQGCHLLTECGCLSVGPADGELVTGVRRAAKEHSLPVQEFIGAELRRRFPAFQFEDDQVGVVETEAGFLYVEACVRAQLDAARQLGAVLHENEAVVSWQVDGQGASVCTPSGRYAADRLVITAGAWAGAALAGLGLPLTVLRKPMLWFGAANDALLRRDIFPIYLFDTPQGFYYGFPVLDSLGHKAARHDAGLEVADPARVDRAVSETDEQECRAFLRRHLPPVNGPLRQGKVCLYTVTPDRHFIIDRHPHHANVALAAGFSGHGFKFAPVVGEILADLVENGSTRWPIDMFRIGRFRQRGQESEV
jgi:sarcosine oxidase